MHGAEVTSGSSGEIRGWQGKKVRIDPPPRIASTGAEMEPDAAGRPGPTTTAAILNK
jgi:hypothetical protein